MFRILAAILVAAGLLLTAAPRAAAELITARDIDKVLEIAQRFGPAELLQASDSAPLIRGEIDGVTYLVLFYGCEEAGGCINIQFGAAWEPLAGASIAQSIARANEWNAQKRFANAYVDTDGAALIKMEANLEFGVERATLEDVFATWRTVLVEFPPFFLQ